MTAMMGFVLKWLMPELPALETRCQALQQVNKIDIKKEINKIGQFSISINLHSDLIVELRVMVEKNTSKK